MLINHESAVFFWALPTTTKQTVTKYK